MIQGANGSGGGSPRPELRLDQIDSRRVFQDVRRAYFHYLEQCPGGAEPIGIIWQQTGQPPRVVFELPVLLPEEHFVPIEMIRGRPGRPSATRLRTPRSPLRP
ncbi:MAG: hypothetical protein ACOVNL_01125 [Prochlorococcaceae cyanobacterium]